MVAGRFVATTKANRLQALTNCRLGDILIGDAMRIVTLGTKLLLAASLLLPAAKTCAGAGAFARVTAAPPAQPGTRSSAQSGAAPACPHHSKRAPAAPKQGCRCVLAQPAAPRLTDPAVELRKAPEAPAVLLAAPAFFTQPPVHARFARGQSPPLYRLLIVRFSPSRSPPVA